MKNCLMWEYKIIK